jgi:hypothetical protein
LALLFRRSHGEFIGLAETLWGLAMLSSLRLKALDRSSNRSGRSRGERKVSVSRRHRAGQSRRWGAYLCQRHSLVRNVAISFRWGETLRIAGTYYTRERFICLTNPELLRQLRALEEHKTPRGNTDVRPAYRSKDALAVAVAVVALQLSKMDAVPMPPISFAEHPRFWMNLDNCPWMIDCTNCPTCHDEGECLGYRGPPVLAGCK